MIILIVCLTIFDFLLLAAILILRSKLKGLMKILMEGCEDE